MRENLYDKLDWNSGTKKYISALMEKVSFYSDVIIFGAGIGGAATLDLLISNGYGSKVKFFADNNTNKIGHYYRDLVVIAPKDVVSYSNSLILISSTAFLTIRQQLVDYGVNKENIYFFQPAGINLDSNKDVDFIKSKFDYLDSVYNLLEDDKSKFIYENILNYRITKDNKYLDSMASYIDNEENQYFDAELLKKQKFTSFIDGGGYTGDTVENFFRKFPNWNGEYYCIEASKDICAILSTKEGGIWNNVKIFNNALWDKKECLYFDTETFGNGGGSHISEKGEEVHADSIDNLFTENKIGFIKMDIEGAERKALLGAKETILKHHPILAICIYHKPEDLFDIPLLIKSFGVTEYKYYIRQYRYGISETVFYAIPNKL